MPTRKSDTQETAGSASETDRETHGVEAGAGNDDEPALLTGTYAEPSFESAPSAAPNPLDPALDAVPLPAPDSQAVPDPAAGPPPGPDEPTLIDVKKPGRLTQKGKPAKSKKSKSDAPESRGKAAPPATDTLPARAGDTPPRGRTSDARPGSGNPVATSKPRIQIQLVPKRNEPGLF